MQIKNGVILSRQKNGIAAIHANSDLDMYYGIGFAHAQDRLMQALLMRVVVNGQLTECFADTEETYAIDFLVRKMKLAADAHADVKNISEVGLAYLNSYVRGFNACFEKKGRPLICKLLGYKPEPWSIEDCSAVLKLQMYLGMAQIQENTERLIIQSIQQGVDLSQLKRLYSPHLDAIDEQLVGHIKKTQLVKPFVQQNIRFLQKINVMPSGGVSNNWVVSGKKSKTQKPILCFDPHLQINRLPNFWYEAIAYTDNNYQVGISTPGFPFMIMGRTANIAGGFTYGLMDTIDFFLEECQGEQVRRGESYHRLTKRTELLKRKKQGDQCLTFYETDSGVLETGSERQQSVNDGQYFSIAWSCLNDGAAKTINAFVELWQSTTVERAQDAASKMGLTCNWLFADTAGNIGYQQSGLLPKRAHSGLYPLPAWNLENNWSGLEAPSQLASEYNPEKGFLATANNDINQEGKPLSVNIPYAPYRFERITSLLQQQETLAVDDMKLMQADLYSLQAESYLVLIRPHLPDNAAGDLLRHWDCRYDKNSQAAVIFEDFYRELLHEFAGKKIFGEQAWQVMISSTSILPFIHANLDAVLLGDDDSWFQEEKRDVLIERVLNKVLSQYQNKGLTLAETQMITFTNIYFDGKLPKFLGFDAGPYPLEGSRATISLGDSFYEGERLIVGGSSYRFISDMNENTVHTVIAGGSSEKRFSRGYMSEIEAWLNHRYKTISISETVKS